MRETLRKTGRFSAWVGLVLAALLAIALGVLQTPWAKRRIRNAIVDRANQSMEGTVQIRRLSGTLLWGATLDGVAVDDGRGHPFAYIRRVEVDYSALALLWGHLEVDDVQVEKPRILLRRYPDGVLNVSTMLPESAPDEDAEPYDIDVTVHQYAVSGGRVAWHDGARTEESARSTAADRVEALIEKAPDARSSDPLDAVRQALADSEATATEVPTTAVVSDLALAGSARVVEMEEVRQRLDSLSFRAESDTTTAPLEGELSNWRLRFAPSGADVTVETASLGPGARVRGLDVGVDLPTGPDAAFVPDAFVATIDNFRVEPELANRFIPDARLEKTVEGSLEAGGGPSRIRANTSADFGESGGVRATVDLQPDPPLTYRVDARARDVALTELLEVDRLDLPEGQVSGALHAEGSGTSPSTLSASTTFGMWESTVEPIRIRRLIGSASVDDGTLELKRFAVDSSHLDARARARADLDGRFELSARTRTGERGLKPGDLDWAPGPTLAVGRADSTLSISGRLNPDADSVPSLVENISGRASWDVGAVQASDYRVDASTGDVSFEIAPTGPAGRAAPSRSRDVSISGRASGSGIELPTRRLGGFRVRGEVDATLDRSATSLTRAFPELDADATGRLSGARAAGLGLGSVSFDASVRDGQTRGSYRGSVSATGAELEAWSARVAEFEADYGGAARLSNAGALDHVEIEGNSTLRNVTAPPGADVQKLQSEVDLSGAPLDPVGTARATLEGVTVRGRTFQKVTADLEAQKDRSLALAARAEPAEGRPPYSVETDLQYSRALDRFEVAAFEGGRGDIIWRLASPTTVATVPSGLQIDQLALTRGSQKVTVDGQFRFLGRSDLEVELVDIDLAEVQTLADLEVVPGLAGRFGSKLHLTGTHQSPELTVSAYGKGLEGYDYGPFAFESKTRARDGWVVVENFASFVGTHELVSGSAEFPLDWDLNGNWQYTPSSRTRVSVDVPDTTFDRISHLVPPLEYFPIDGRFDGSFLFKGPIRQPSIDSRFAVRDVSVHGKVAGSRVDIDGVRSETTFRFGERSKADKRLEFSSGLEWNGRQLASLAVSTDAKLAEWGVAYGRGETKLATLARRLADEELELSASLERTDVGKIPLESFKSASAEGQVGGALELKGSLLKPDASLQLDVEDFGWNEFRDIFFNTDVRLSRDKLHVDKFRVEWDADEILAAHGSLPFPLEAVTEGRSFANAPLDLAVQLKPMSLTKLGPVKYAFNKFQGTLSGYLHLSGTLASPKVDARLSLADARFDERDRGTVSAWVTADDRGVEGGAIVCRESSAILTAEFDVPLDLAPMHLLAGGSPWRDAPISASVQGNDVPIKQLVPTPLVSNWVRNAGGYMQVDLSLDGTWGNLEPSGTFAVEDGTFTLVPYNRGFNNIEIQSTIADGRVGVETFQVDDKEQGQVRANGEIALDQLAPKSFDFSVETKDFDGGDFTVGFPALVTADADVSGTVRDETHQVDVKVNSLDAVLPEDDKAGTSATGLSGDIVVVESHEENQTYRIDNVFARASTLADVLNANIDIQVSEDSRVHHPNGTLQFSADMRADLRGTTVTLKGKMDAVKGEFEFLGKDFNVERTKGIVRFTGSSPPNPRIDVVAIHPLDRSIVAQLDPVARDKPRIFVRVSGTVYEPSLDMTSEPSMSESEIIYVLMTGRPPANAEVGQEEGVASRAAAAAGGIFSALIQQKVSKTIPIDMLRFESGESGLEGSKVRVGKYIGKNLFISSAYEFAQQGEEAGWETRVEWHFAPRWMIEAVYGDEQTGTLDAFWDIY